MADVRQLIPKALWMIALVSTLVAAPKWVHAADDKRKACLSTYEEGQRLRKDRKLLEAREKFLFCAQDFCPNVARKDCTVWAEEVEQAIPTFVFAAETSDGRDLLDVALFLDGEKIADQLDGKVISVEPGPHTVRFEAKDRRPYEETLLAREGEKSRRIVARFALPPDSAIATPAFTTRRKDTPVLTYVFGGVGVAGLAVFGIFAARGLVMKGDLDNQRCSPSCAPSKVNPIRESFLIGDIGLAAGVASLGVAATLYVIRGTERVEAEKPSTSFVVGPTGAAVVGSF